MLKKGDKVIVIRGKDKGKSGTIVRYVRKDDKVVIDGINMVKRARRGRRASDKGTIVDTAMPLHASKVQIVDPKTGKPSRLGKKKVGDVFVRVARKSDQEV